MNYFKLVLFLFCLNTCFASEDTTYIHYYNCRNEAYFHFYEQDFKTAKIYFDKAFSLKSTPFELDEYAYAMTLSELGDTTTAINLLKRIKKTMFILKDTSYFKNISSSTKQKLSTDAIIREKVFYDSVTSQSVQIALDKLKTRDQELRFLIQEFQLKYEKDTLIQKRLIDSILVLDKVNHQVMDSLYKITGFIGNGPSDNFYNFINLNTFITHSGADYYTENAQFLQKELKEGRLPPEVYALGIDRFFYKNFDLPEYYGFHTHLIDTTVKPEEYFKRLTSIGLNPYLYTKKRIFYRIEVKGKIPKSAYYDYFKANKDKFNACQ